MAWSPSLPAHLSSPLRWLRREPMAQCVLIGAALFGLHAAVIGGQPKGEIQVSAEQVAALSTLHRRTWQRPPTAAELNGLVDDWIREEVAVREARALGLDQVDPIIRRRLRQKLEFLAEERADQRQPTDADLRRWLRSHPERYRREPSFTFQQVALDPASPKGTPAQRAATLLALLNSATPPKDVGGLGDPLLLLDTSYTSVSAGEVRRVFGADFAAALPTLKTGVWVGPVPSGYGAHLVRIQAVTPGAALPLEEVREAVERDWRVEERRGERDRAYREWMGRYRIQRPPSLAPAPGEVVPR
jgi:hypothetical protein